MVATLTEPKKEYAHKDVGMRLLLVKQIKTFITQESAASIQIGEKLLELRKPIGDDAQLWQTSGETLWGKFIQKEFGFSRVHAFNLMGAAKLLPELPTLASGYQWTERSIRPLTKLRTEDREEVDIARAKKVAKKAVTKTEGKITAKKISEAVREELNKEAGTVEVSEAARSVQDVAEARIGSLRGAVERFKEFKKKSPEEWTAYVASNARLAKEYRELAQSLLVTFTAE